VSQERRPDGDVIAVRPDEGFDEQRLRAWLRGRLEGSDGPLRVDQFGGGHANLTYRLRFGAGPGAVEYVLRRPPLGPVAPGSHDMQREYRALSVLWKAFPLAPRAFLYCEGPEPIGAPFVVMECRRGVVVRGVVPPEFGGGQHEGANRRLSEMVVDVLADLHAVDPKPIGLDALGRDPERFLERQVRGWADRYERARTRSFAVADELVKWLVDARPASGPPTLLHNDWRLDNMAVAPDDPGRCVAVFDWDMCTVGDPLADLGTLLAMWFDREETPVGRSSMPTQLPGWLPRREAVRRYGERSGRAMDAVAWYDVFGTFKMAVVLQQIYYRWQRGQTRDERFAGLESAAEGLFELAASRRP
jgi:aminoglycoside phosphotransferase (APT) family kinase protein